jgi:hypothetical protein
MNKTFSILYIKQSSSLNVGHVYEHAIIKQFEVEAYRNGFLRGVDYDWDAETYDGIVSSSIMTNKKRLLTIFGRVLNESKINDMDIKKAVDEISCEYNSPYICDFNLLYNEIARLSNEKWIKYDDFLITAPVKEVGWSIKNSPVISFKKSKKLDYDVFSFAYSFKNVQFELRPLAVYLVQLLALAQIDFFYNRTPEFEACYDKGDEWAEWQFENGSDLIGYSHRLTLFSRQKISTRNMRLIFDRNYKEIVDKGFVRKLIEFLKIESNRDYKYFSKKEMVKNSGALMGKKWFKEFCSSDNVNYLLDNMEITIKKEINK